VGHQVNVRLSQNGVFYWRREMESRNPHHRYSWTYLDPTDPISMARTFTSRTLGPSTPAPINLPHLPTHGTYRPLDADAAVCAPAGAVVAAGPHIHGGRIALRTILNAPPIEDPARRRLQC
jgi:hypothetical protein